MSEIVEQARRRANRRHTCFLCGYPIEKGETYVSTTARGYNGLYRISVHDHCQMVSNGIWDWVDPDDGMTCDEFYDAVRELMETFVCPWHCEKYDRDSVCGESVSDSCIRKFADYLETHRLRLVQGKFGFEWKMEEVKTNGQKKEDDIHVRDARHGNDGEQSHDQIREETQS